MQPQPSYVTPIRRKSSPNHQFDLLEIADFINEIEELARKNQFNKVHRATLASEANRHVQTLYSIALEQ